MVVAQSVILRGEGGKPLRAVLSNSPNKPHVLVGVLDDGTKVAVAKRGGNGGVDMNKFASGRILAVAADGFAPLYEKDEEGKPTSQQKTFEGMPYFAASGFYVLSNKDYEACDIWRRNVRLVYGGEILYACEEAEVEETLTMREDLRRLNRRMAATLAQEPVSQAWADALNRKKERVIRRAQEDAEDMGEAYSGVAYTPLAAAAKDGSHIVRVRFEFNGESHELIASRFVEVAEDAQSLVQPLRFVEPQEAVSAMWATSAGRRVLNACNAGVPVRVRITKGSAWRTSPAFRRKLDAIQNGSYPGKDGYGDAVWIKAALQGWVPGIVSILPMLHPEFPEKDYDALHFVATARQSKIELVRQDEGKWVPRALFA